MVLSFKEFVVTLAYCNKKSRVHFVHPSKSVKRFGATIACHPCTCRLDTSFEFCFLHCKSILFIEHSKKNICQSSVCASFFWHFRSSYGAVKFRELTQTINRLLQGAYLPSLFLSYCKVHLCPHCTTCCNKKMISSFHLVYILFRLLCL